MQEQDSAQDQYLLNQVAKFDKQWLFCHLFSCNVIGVPMNRNQREKLLFNFGTRDVSVMLRARQPLKLLSDDCIKSRSVACILTVVKKANQLLRKLT